MERKGFSVQFRKTLVFALASVLLTACGGGSIDTKNTDTFRSSLNKMMSDLSQEERTEVAAGMSLLAQNLPDDEVTLRTISGAERDAEGLVLISSAENGDQSIGFTSVTAILADVIDCSARARSL